MAGFPLTNGNSIFSWATLIERVGVTSVMALAILYLLLPRLDHIIENQAHFSEIYASQQKLMEEIKSRSEQAQDMSSANHDILVGRGDFFRDLIFLSVNNCVHASHSSAEESLCFATFDHACDQINQIEQTIKNAKHESRNK